MRTIAALALLGMLLSAAAGTAVSVQRGDTKSIEDAVLAVSAEMTKAGESADADALFSYILENDKGSVIQNGVFFATRQEALERVRQNLRPGSRTIRYQWKRQYVTVLSPEVAVLTAEGTVAATAASGETITTPLAQTIVFVLRAGSWKAIHAHQSMPIVR
jgi:uncharacterized protein (TIGR02246 family)